MTDENRIQTLIRLLKDDVLFDDDIEIKPDSNFKALDAWDSLAVMGFISVISDQYGVEIPFDEMEAMTTVFEVNEYIGRN